jgi:hypothetical protein
MHQFEISPFIYHNKDFLKKLSQTRSSIKCKYILKKATTTQLLALVEICLNILISRLNLTARQKRRLFPHAQFLRQLSRARSERGARKLSIQTGSGVPGLFAAILTPILIELARGAFSKNGQ